jgi:hypothetical protein
MAASRLTHRNDYAQRAGTGRFGQQGPRIGRECCHKLKSRRRLRSPHCFDGNDGIDDSRHFSLNYVVAMG